MIDVSEQPELALLVATTARPLMSANVAAIAAGQPERSINWGLFLELVAHHRVSALTFDGLRSALVVVPYHIYHTLRTWALRDRANALQLTNVLTLFTEQLAPSAIKFLVLKGPALAITAFDDLSIRHSSDLDLLIDPADLVQTLLILQSTDFDLDLPINILSPDRLYLWKCLRKDLMIVHLPTGTIIELHWRFNDNPYLLPYGNDLMFDKVNIGHKEFLALHNHVLLLYLCVHGTKHLWFRAKWLSDIYAMLRRYNIDIEELRNSAVSHSLSVAVDVALLMMMDLYNFKMPTKINRLINRSLRAKIIFIVCRYLIKLSPTQTNTSIYFLLEFLCRLLLNNNLRYLCREVFSCLIDWPVAMALGGSRWAYAISIAGRPFYWLFRRVRL